jgi:hypothetical protein
MAAVRRSDAFATRSERRAPAFSTIVRGTSFAFSTSERLTHRRKPTEDTMRVTIFHRGETVTADEANWQRAADELVARLGPWEPGASRVEKQRSDFGATVMDDGARERIERQHEALRNAGVDVDAGRQLYETGTRMADVGYRNQAARAAEHAAKQPIADAVHDLVSRIEAEQRHDVETTARKLGEGLSINGALKVDGFKLREQAIRGLLARMESPALRYVLGLRDRIAGPDATEASKALDKAALLDVMQRECRRFGDTPIKLRTREGLGDVFAIVSPDYAAADAPEVLGDVVSALPSDARGTFSYDPTSTAWELRASVFTPTPVDEQAVGEPFEGYVSFSSRDNGTRRLTGGGGIVLLACLNASTYEAESQSVSRVHRGAILTDLAAMYRDASTAIRALCQAWGVARADVLAQPTLDGALVPIEEAIPGFYRAMLTARRGELVGVLPGRTETHVKALAMAFGEERRDRSQLVRADMAQGFTRYIQDQPAPVRRDAESAIARWMVKREPVSFVAA